MRVFGKWYVKRYVCEVCDGLRTRGSALLCPLPSDGTHIKGSSRYVGTMDD